MPISTDTLTADQIGSAMIANPLLANRDTPVITAITLMRDARQQGGSDAARASCVLVLESNQVVGIFTEADVVRMIAQRQSPENMTMDAVMTKPVITTRASAFTDLSTIIHLLQHHRILHLPVVDAQDQLIGLVTAASLWESIGIKTKLLNEHQTILQGLQENEHDLQVQREFNQLIAEITSRFVDLHPEHLDAEIQSTLRLIGETTQVDTCYIFQYDIEKQTSSMTHEWVKEGCQSQIAIAQEIDCWRLFPWSSNLLDQCEVVYIPNIADLPPEAAIDQANWRQANIAAILLVSLTQKSGMIGAIGFASFSQPIVWREDTIRLLQVMGQAITNMQERIQNEQKLIESEERLRLALISANQGMYDLNIQTGIAIVNSEYALMLGYDPATFVETNAKWIERLHPDDREHVAQIYRDYVAGILPDYKVEFRQQTTTGEWKWILSIGKILAWDEMGNPLRMLGTHMDISDRKKAEAERLLAKQVQQELNLLENILDVVLAGYWDWDLQTNQEYLSTGFKRMFGYAEHELADSPETWQRLIFAEDLPSVLECFERHVQSHGEIPYYNEVRYHHKDGSTVWVNCSGKIIEWDQDDKPVRMIGCHIDITKQKQAEIELLNLSDRLTLAVKSGNIAIWDWNVTDNTLICNDRMYELYGIVRTQLFSVYDTWVSRIHQDDQPIVEAAIQEALAGRKDYDSEFRVMLDDGSIRYVKAYSLVRRNAVGEAIRMIGMNIDISDRKQSEAQLLQTTAQLAASNRELEAFAYSVSHDLRSPLRAIDGFSQALLEDYGNKLDAEGKIYFDRIRHNVERMGNLIDDLLRLSRLSRSEMRYSQVNLSLLVQEQIEELQMAEPERRVEIAIASDVYVSADISLMRVVVNNLIQNAWKFTSHHTTARIEFGIATNDKQQEYQQEQPIYFVRDDGAGFDMKYADMLFGVFQRLHNTNEFAGTGIGLATVQRVIHRHGGQVWAEAAVEQGATIYFTVPQTLANTSNLKGA
ncbi:PAS domain-containing protein [Pseudanabaena mucicola]|uniref:histidine kinase n=1 Tax=Pseudanabaena mucicola FACHB-723 TaxID=2692860 RepID=A0ABR7ZTA9_9CYAN|nr:PAS domain-containing protein [Pseudanabaena mucicola]MBD2187019.1 PAS domain-containing protein [Pseudanabaena mucicola FACHB-723]